MLTFGRMVTRRDFRLAAPESPQDIRDHLWTLLLFGVGDLRLERRDAEIRVHAIHVRAEFVHMNVLAARPTGRSNSLQNERWIFRQDAGSTLTLSAL